jgi:hypothetical protein
MQHEDAMTWQHVGPICSSPTKNFCHTYRWRTLSRWQFTHNPVVSSNDSTYETWLAYQVMPMHLMLHGQRCIHYENVFTHWRRDHKTSLGPHALGTLLWPITRQRLSPYCTIGTVLKQISSWGDRFGIHITQREDTYLLTFSSVCCYRKVNCKK